jgi:hypothetical protein
MRTGGKDDHAGLSRSLQARPQACHKLEVTEVIGGELTLIASGITALTATVIGSLAACVLLYGLTLALGQVRAYRILDWLVGLAGMPASRKDRIISSLQSRQHLLAFGSQLVPTVRLVSPVIAGIFRADPRAFTIATAAGIVIWNALFISAGHVAAAVAPASNASSLAISYLRSSRSRRAGTRSLLSSSRLIGQAYSSDDSARGGG